MKNGRMKKERRWYEKIVSTFVYEKVILMKDGWKEILINNLSLMFECHIVEYVVSNLVEVVE